MNHPLTFQRGFSLIEMLLGMAITSIIMVLLYSLVGQSVENYTHTHRAVNTVSQARAFIHFFERELSTRLPGSPMIHEKGSVGSVMDADKIAFVRTVSNHEQETTHPGDLSLVCYHVAFTEDAPNIVSPKLFRSVRSTEETQTFLNSSSTPTFPPENPDLDEAIVANVIGFTAQPRFYSGSPLILEDWTATSPEPPCVIEMTIHFLDDSSAQRFRTQADWERLADSPKNSEQQLIRTYARSIAIAK